MTQSEFIKIYCGFAQIEERILNECGTSAIPCTCGLDDCLGWAMVGIDNLKDHCNLYAKIPVSKGKDRKKYNLFNGKFENYEKTKERIAKRRSKEYAKKKGLTTKKND